MIIRKEIGDCILKSSRVMGKSFTPIPAEVDDLEQELRDSHVRLKDVPDTEKGWESIESDLETPRRDESSSHLHLVSITPKEPVPPVDPDDGAEIIQLQYPVKGLVAAERKGILNEAEARFHKRDAIEQAVRTARESTAPPAPPTPRRGVAKIRHLPRAAFWIAGAFMVCATIAVAMTVVWSLYGAEPAPSQTLEAPPLSSVQLELRDVPQGATVRVDGQPIQGSAIELPIDGRSHSLSVEAEGYQSWTLNLTPEVDEALPVQLVPENTED